MRDTDKKKSFSNKKNTGKSGTFGKKPASKATAPKVPGEWFYMCPSEIMVENIQEALETMEGIDIEVWKEMGVLEAQLPTRHVNQKTLEMIKKGTAERPDTVSLDFSLLELDLEDEYSNQYLKEHEVKTLFSVSFKPDTYTVIKPALLSIKDILGGFFCGDTEDFTPEI